MIREKQIELAYDNASKNKYTSFEAVKAFVEGMNQYISIDDLVGKINVVIDEGVRLSKYNNVFDKEVEHKVKNLKLLLKEFVNEYKRPA